MHPDGDLVRTVCVLSDDRRCDRLKPMGKPLLDGPSLAWLAHPSRVPILFQLADLRGCFTLPPTANEPSGSSRAAESA